MRECTVQCHIPILQSHHSSSSCTSRQIRLRLSSPLTPWHSAELTCRLRFVVPPWLTFRQTYRHTVRQHLISWYLSSLDRSPYDVIQGAVTLVSGNSSATGCRMPFSPRASTIFPHMHVCGSQALQPNRWATATLTASSESLSPTAVIGAAWSQSPAWGVDTARSLALSVSLEALDKMMDHWFAATIRSQAFWMWCTSAAGLGELAGFVHRDSVHWMAWSSAA